MKTFVKKAFGQYLFATILIGVVVFALFKVNIKFSNLEKEINTLKQNNTELTEKYDGEMKDIFDILLGTQSDFTSALQQEQIKNSHLASQFSEVANTVGALEKLSETDPELLKKYSKVYFLNEHYVPVALSEIPVDYRSKTSTNFQIHADVLYFLEKMLDAAKSESSNLEIKAQSAYRSFAIQAALKEGYSVTYGAGANKFSADQGYSEHQLGTTVDLTTVKLNGALSGFDKTNEYKWMKENAYKFGFILSYPPGNTYYKFEPWHWRFVGVELATKLHEQNKNFYDADQRFIDNYLIKIFDHDQNNSEQSADNTEVSSNTN
jgi:D-alanyl-D-alanine carboxypeptidase